VSTPTDEGGELPDLLYSENEDELRAAVRDALSDTAPWPEVLAATERPDPYLGSAWKALSREIGCAGLVIPERFGGAGSNAGALAVVAEEIGRSVAPVPFLGSAVLATSALLACDGGDTVGRLLTALALGESTAALAVPLSTGPGAVFRPSVQVDGDRLTGRVTSVVDAESSSVVIVPAATADGGLALYAVNTGDIRSLTPVTALDQTRALHDVEFDGTQGTVIADTALAGGILGWALLYGAAMLAAEQLGIAERCLESTVEYVRTRYQFGRPIGANQALRHRLADLWVEVTQARAVSRYAAACLADGIQRQTDDNTIAVAIAKAHCSEVAVHAAEEQIQLHGGIGFTWEHPAHLHLKRAKSNSIALGTPDRHRARLATLVDLPL
jgi:alkylation response protein AidB-like acyl-CoA dehydrogenase